MLETIDSQIMSKIPFIATCRTHDLLSNRYLQPSAVTREV